MPICAISLPRQRLANREGDIEATLQATMSVDLPLELEYLSSLDAFVLAVAEKRLWIARVGSCTLSVVLATLGGPLSALERDLVKGWVQEHGVS